MSEYSNELSCINCERLSKLNPDIVFLEDSASKISLCDECISYFNTAVQTLLSNDKSNKFANSSTLPTPIELLSTLNDHVIKQDEAKKTIAIAVAHHYRRLRDPSIGKSNVLIVGPTGTGKTEIARSIARFLNVPFASADASSLTARGFVGDDPESIVRSLLVSANFNADLAETGIVFIDEIDKIAKTDGKESGIGTTSVQQQLLTLLEGSKVQIKIPADGGGESYVVVDTSKILFICSGAFVGIEDIINKTDKGVGLAQIGMHATLKESTTNYDRSESILKKMEASHLIKFGIIPELMGRLPVVTYTSPLLPSDLVRILLEPKDSLLKKYTRLFELDEVNLVVSESTLESIAREAYDKRLGARGLRGVFEERLRDHFMNVHLHKGKELRI